MTGQHAAMLRAALVPTGWLAGGCLLGGALTSGWAGVFAALLGAAVVLLVLGVGLGVMVLTTRWSPTLTMGSALAAFMASSVLVGYLLVQARSQEAVSRPTFAVTTVLLTLAWVVGMARAHSRWTRTGSPNDFPEALMRPVLARPPAGDDAPGDSSSPR